jgi:anthranilate/para-aminobenzoate synthase component I
VEQAKRNPRSAVFESGVEQLKRNSPARFVLLDVNNTETSPLAHTRPSY